MTKDDLRLDWYEATLECDTVTLIAMCELVAGLNDPPTLIYGKGRHGYKRSCIVSHEKFELTILDLGNGGWPHMIASGPSAETGMRIAKQLNVIGRVSRIDVACDSNEGWLPAEKRVLNWIDTHPKTALIAVGDFYRGGTDIAKDGRTYYIGAATSEKRIRVYEKGRKTDQPDWVRVELQYRPNNRGAKTWAFNASTEEIANSSRAFLALRATTGLYAPPLYERPARQPIVALAHQYGRILKAEVPDAWRAINQYLRYEYVPPTWKEGNDV